MGRRVAFHVAVGFLPGYDLVEHHEDIPAHSRVGALIDGDCGGGMWHVQHAQAFANVGFFYQIINFYFYSTMKRFNLINLLFLALFLLINEIYTYIARKSEVVLGLEHATILAVLSGYYFSLGYALFVTFVLMTVLQMRNNKIAFLD